MHQTSNSDNQNRIQPKDLRIPTRTTHFHAKTYRFGLPGFYVKLYTQEIRQTPIFRTFTLFYIYPATLALLLQFRQGTKTNLKAWRNKVVGRSVKNPKKHIFSCRVNEGEMESLQHLTEESGIIISELLRQTLLQLCDQPHQNTQQAA